MDYENCDNLLRKALDVDNVPEDFDPTKMPETGEEFLHYVMYEAQQCEEYIKADIDEKLLRRDPYLVQVLPECKRAHESYLLSSKEQIQQADDFSLFHDHLVHLKTTIPDLEESRYNNDPNYWLEKCQHVPLLSELISYSQRNLLKLLNLHIVWLDDVKPSETIPHVHGIWIYSLLACLDTPLMPEVCFDLRALARKCSEIRERLVDDADTIRERIKPLNLIICIIARYFKQYDLVDNVN